MSAVLVVDDDYAALSHISSQLRQLGHVVRTVAHPEHALSLVEGGWRPDVAVLEVSTPDMTGFELASFLHECPQTRRLPVLFVSDVIREAATFTDDGVTAKYLNKSDIDRALPEAIRELAPKPSVPA